MTKEEKMRDVRKILNIKRSDDSRNKLYSILKNWDFNKNGKITHRNIYQQHPITKKTVQKYLKEFQEYVDDLNAAFKNLEYNLSEESPIATVTPNIGCTFSLKHVSSNNPFRKAG